MRMRIHKAGQHDFACAVNLGNLFAILLEPRIAKCVFRRSNRNNLSADAENGAFRDDTELFEIRPATWRGRFPSQGKKLSDVGQEYRRLSLRSRGGNGHAPAV